MENREKVPVRYRKNAQTAALLDTLGLSAQQMADLVEDVKKQFFIETATWSLPLWEQQVGIAPPTGATEASRRSALKARLLAGGNTTADTIRDMATGEVTPTGLPSSNVLYYDMNDNAWLCIRPSGTEPKIKFYYGIKGTSLEDADAKSEALGKALMAEVDKLL